MSRPTTIVEIAHRTHEGVQPFDSAVREFLDAWQSMDRIQRETALRHEPVGLDRFRDTYLAALTEYLALSDRIPAPAWTEHPQRFLDEPFFAGGLESLKATLLAESPLSFRRRLIFISADGLHRPKRTSSSSEEENVHVRA